MAIWRKLLRNQFIFNRFVAKPSYCGGSRVKTDCEKVSEATKKSMSVNPFPYNQKKGEPMSKMNWKIFENRDSSIYLWLNWFLYNITHRFSIDFDIFRRTQKRNVSIALVHRFDVMLSISISHSIKTGCTAEKKKKKRDREKG